MKDLKQLQNEFADYLSGNKLSPISDDIVADEKADVQERLGFYHDAYRLRLIEVLSLDYPGLSGLLGEEQFGRLALSYLRHYPSRYRSIRWFGLHLPEFLHNGSSDFSGDDNTLSQKLWEMSCFEKAQNDVFDAESTSLASVEDLAVIDPAFWADMRIDFIAAMQRLDLHYNIPQIWLELEEKKVQADGGELEWIHREQPQSWLVWRSDLEPQWRALDLDEAWAIDELQQGASFGDVCEGLTEWVDEQHVPLRAVTILKTLVVDKVVQGIASTS